MEPIRIVAYDWPQLNSFLTKKLGYKKVHDLWNWWCKHTRYHMAQNSIHCLPIGYWGYEEINGVEVPCKPTDPNELYIWQILEEVRQLIKPTNDLNDYKVFVWW